MAAGDLSTRDVLVRVHSECVTGDVFGSMRCDCGAQLEAALKSVAEHSGLVLYMGGHEGRGIGRLNKLAAYAMQERGHDTVEANLQLGLPADSREYGAAAAILGDLGVSRVRLLTNNPAKVTGLTIHGVNVVERVPLRTEPCNGNAAYLRTKESKMGHYPTSRGRASWDTVDQVFESSRMRAPGS